MAIADRQQLSEIVDTADILVRVSSQLRLLKVGKSLRDKVAIEQAVAFLTTAIDGGQFITTGTVGGLQSTLRPLTWVADVRLGSPSPNSQKNDQLARYEELVAFVRDMRSVLEGVLTDGRIVNSDQVDVAIDFFKRLGNQLGVRADQMMRQSPSVFGISEMMVGK